MKISVISATNGMVLEQFEDVEAILAGNGVIRLTHGNYDVAVFVISPNYPIYIRPARPEDKIASDDVSNAITEFQRQLEKVGEHLIPQPPAGLGMRSVPDSTGNDIDHED